MQKLGLFIVLAITLIFTASCVSKQVPVTKTYFETQYRTEEYSGNESVITTIQGEDDLKSDRYWNIEELGMWYHSYELPQHDASQLILDIPPKEPQNYGGMVICPPRFTVGVYDMTKVGYLSEWDMPVPKCTNYYDVDNPKHTWTECNLTEDERAAFEVWLDSVNSQLKSDLQLGGIDSLILELKGTQPSHIDVTGIKTVAIVVRSVNSYPGLSLRTDPISFVKLAWSDNITEEKIVTKQRQIPYQVEKQRTVMQTKKVPFWEVFSSGE